MLDTSCYNRNITEERFLNIIENLKLKNYKLIKTKEYFFIFQKLTKNKKPAHEYIRLTLMRTEDILFYWDLETSFKPYNYKHNHRDKAHIQSQYFNADSNINFFNEFLNMIDIIKEYVKSYNQ
jgi:hypothetical protein